MGLGRFCWESVTPQFKNNNNKIKYTQGPEMPGHCLLMEQGT